MKTLLTVLTLFLLSLSGFSQGVQLVQIRQLPKPGPVLYNASTIRQIATYPLTTAGLNSFTAAASSGAFSLSVLCPCGETIIIPAGTKPPVSPPCLTNCTSAPSWASSWYDYNGTLFSVRATGDDQWLKFERADGQAISLTNPNNIPINNTTFYDHATLSGNIYQWQVNWPSAPQVKLTYKNKSTGATYVKTFTPAVGASNVNLFTAGSSGGGGSSSCNLAVAVNSPTVGCGGTATLTATASGTSASGLTYSWTGPNGYTASGASIAVTMAQSNGSYQYTVTASKTGCSASATSTVSVTGCSTTNPGSGSSTIGYAGMFGPNSGYVPLGELNRPSLQQTFPRSFLDNGTVKVGVNVKLGSVIDFLSFGSGPSTVNSPIWTSTNKDDAGRQIMDAAYMNPDGQVNPAHPTWAEGYYTEGDESTGQFKNGAGSIGNNPVQGGNQGDNPKYGQTNVLHNDGTKIYYDATPVQWDMVDIFGQMKMEGWIQVDPNNSRAIRRHARWTLNRTDSFINKYPTPRQNEAPCWYTTTDYKEVYYVAGQPWTNAPLIQYSYNEQANNIVRPFILASEPAIYMKHRTNGRYIVLVATNARFGVGGFNLEGFTGNAPTSFNANYMASGPQISLDPSGVYDFDSAMFEGTESECRAYVNSLTYLRTNTWNGLPEYVFNQKSRFGFFLHNAYDQLEKNMTDYISVKPLFNNENNGRDYNISLPEKWINGRAVKHIYMRIAASSQDGQFYLRWKKPGLNSSPEYFKAFDITANGQFQTVHIDMTGVANWDDNDITTFAIMKRNNNDVTNDELKFKWISYRDLTSTNP